MKKIAIYLLCLIPLFSIAQDKHRMLDETTVKRVSVGFDFYQDFWFKWPAGMDVRAINQGAGTFIMYNIPLGKSPLSFCLGAGIGCHNLFSNSRIEDIKADTIRFTPIPDALDFKKSKLGLTYLDFPIELRLYTKKKIRASLGVKLGYLLDSKTKYKGDDLNGNQVILKSRTVDNVDKFRFAPMVRFGYDWIQIMACYSVTQIFDKGLGPELYPFSVGLTFMPF